MECKHYEHYDGHEITQRAAGAEVSRGCGRAGNHAALRYDGDSGTGRDAGTDGEAGKELCLSSELGAVGQKGRRLPVEDKQREGEKGRPTKENKKLSLFLNVNLFVYLHAEDTNRPR